MENKHYVYAVFVDSRLKYIGKGKGDRFEHGCSGCSHVFGLNEAFFDGKLIEVGIVKDHMTDSQAIELEMSLVGALGNSSNIALYNLHGNTLSHETYPNMTEEEFYAECLIVRSERYVRGEYVKSKTSVYSDKGLVPMYPL